MKEFLFRKNLWMMDFITSIIFAFCLGYCIRLISDDDKEYKLIDLACGVLAYAITFVLAFNLQKKIVWLPSWAWLGILGALNRILFLQLLSVPIYLEYLEKSSSIWVGIYKIISGLIIGTTVNWIFWGIAGLLCIFTVRIIAYLFQAIYISYDKYKKGFPKMH